MTETPATGAARPIVVGTDGSPPARQAVLFALREAQLRGVTLRAVCAYDYVPARHTGMERMAWPGTSGAYPRSSPTSSRRR